MNADPSRVHPRNPWLEFRSIEEMNRAPINSPESDSFERFLRLCARYWAIAPKRYPRGVFKFRTIEEAQKARAKHTLLNNGSQ